MKIHYIDRITKKEEVEKVYGGFFVNLLYGKHLFRALFSFWLLPLAAKIPLGSHLVGLYQKSRVSRLAVKPFIKQYGVDPTEFLDDVEDYQSFNDFFIRKLRPGVRPIVPGHDVAVLPADGRYLVFEKVSSADSFWIKGKKFCLKKLLQDDQLADSYEGGGMVIARLCPVDYHRFHFPCNALPSGTQNINGPLHSVNPIALKRYVNVLTENKRAITHLQTKSFGQVLFIEVGAMYVGSIHQTYVPGELYAKGDEKGYFSFGGSCIILLFEPGRIQFDQDLVDETKRKLEVRGQMGQSLGRALNPY